jgi:hypothetical protein
MELFPGQRVHIAGGGFTGRFLIAAFPANRNWVFRGLARLNSIAPEPRLARTIKARRGAPEPNTEFKARNPQPIRMVKIEFHPKGPEWIS